MHKDDIGQDSCDTQSLENVFPRQLRLLSTREWPPTRKRFNMNPLEQVTQQILLGPAVRQNHALEHATIALLSSRYPESRLSGISFAQGFFIFGEIPTQAIRPIAEQALARLRGAEPELAIHERCGTNLAVTSMLTGFSAMTVARLRRPYNTFSNVLLASTAALLLSRPLGLLVQRFVTTRTPVKPLRSV